MKGGELMPISRTIRDRAHQAIVGMTHDQVIEISGLSRSTLRDLVAGSIVGEDKYVKFAKAVGDDPVWYLKEKRAVVPAPNAFDLLGHVLSKDLCLSPTACRDVIRLARECYAAEHEPATDEEAA
jgi:hypothetical protein